MKALIFHGTCGSPEGNWFPWLEGELKAKGWEVHVPKLPTPEEQTLENWKLSLKEQVPDYSNADVVIGHSCGGAFALRLLEQSLIRPQQTILVGAVIDFGNQFDDYNKTFIDTPFNWRSIEGSCSNITVFHGDDDPYVSMDQAETISKNVNASLQVIANGGHLNEEAGYLKFIDLLNIINV